ncbi:glycerophosphodiester phosphodiesterase family protein [Aquabacter spiritensis]|uniref:Glycerophosphoryl diester phosphodiesterase n=1 Tax=Aquabacter spiritensis TaxID=933073 RepID=A0A4V2UWW6_9HYPH|nr:glycerophosphodiester phosphodiesterase family protein [Aquabacter spiritensis]TCT00968.1 glycerophosphoryl diester phosphodiesterase [Aquabacter spiritensis]
MRDLGYLTRQPVAHRGLHDAGRGIVENTGTAILAAAQRGYGIEIDVQPSADGEAMVFHDDTLDRLTLGSGETRAFSAAQLKRIPFRNTPDTILTLGEALALVEGRVPLLIELKSRFSGDVRLAARVVAVLGTYRGPIGVMSFDPEMIAEVRRLDPARVRGIVSARHFGENEWRNLAPGTRRDLRHLLHWPRTRFQFLAYRVADIAALPPRVLRALGMPVFAWTVRTVAEREMASAYADQMIFEGFQP